MEAASQIKFPRLNQLTQRQIRGLDCVWDGIVLTPDTARDLTPRFAQFAGMKVQWYPRECRRHQDDGDGDGA